MAPCRWLLWTHFHKCFKQDWQYPTINYPVSAAQRSRSARCGEGHCCPWHCHSDSIGRICWCQCVPTEGHGWHWTYCPAHVGQQSTHHPRSWVRARFAWGVDTWPRGGGCTSKPSSMRADKGFPSLWMWTPSMWFVHSKLCKVAVVVCRCRTSRLIFKGIWKTHQLWQWKNLATTAT